MLLLLDNYDSFTYNLVQYLQELLNEEIVVHRNDAIALDQVSAFNRIVLSPGPGLPQDAGIMLPLIRRYAGEIPILGVCLGHQAITMAYGGELRRLNTVLHGLSRKVIVTDLDNGFFKGISSPVDTGRYHSWVPDEASFPNELLVTATDENGCIMALRHRSLPVYGVQFHPESVMTPFGKQMLENWLLLTESNKVSLS